MIRSFAFCIVCFVAILLCSPSGARAMNGIPRDTMSTDTSLLAHSDSLAIRVHVAFTVNKRGKIKKVKIVRSECAECTMKTLITYEELALTAFRSIPSLGTGSGKKMEFVLPLTFTIAK